MKEQQYNKIIAALKQTAEENAAKWIDERKLNDVETVLNPNQEEWKDTLEELNGKKSEVHDLQERVLQLELKAEKTALDYKIQLQ